MLKSLHEHSPEAKVAVYCFDRFTYDQLRSLDWKFVLPVSLEELETNPKLAAAKPSRNRREYCWTSTPFSLLHSIEKLGFQSCIYLDADIFFFSKPDPIFDEFADASVLLTEHRYTPKFDQSQLSGKYCVQFVGIRADENGMKALRWWSDACAEWCFDRQEQGKFGDQKYLDDWLTRFEGVHSIQHIGAGVAPWNIQQYKLYPSPYGPTIQTSAGSIPVVFFHFHGLKLLNNGFVDLSEYPLPNGLEIIYKPYLEALKGWEYYLGNSNGFQSPKSTPPSWRRLFSRLIKGTLNHRKF